MKLSERIEYFEDLFNDLEMTTSRNDKLDIVDSIPDELKDDFIYIVECLEGMHPFGYKMANYTGVLIGELPEFTSIKSILKWLQTPKNQEDMSRDNIYAFVIRVPEYAYNFIQQIVDREYKIGIGKSLLEKKITSPMLAKKFEGILLPDANGYFITEKLDGNRCIASYNLSENKWIFTSRNGKQMNVNFDMGDLSKNFIYDGEVLSPEQVEMSTYISMAVNSDKGYFKRTFNSEFNKTSGLINQKTSDKNLIYNIFDIVDGHYNYSLRRSILQMYSSNITNYISKNVRILPVLKHLEKFDYNTIVELLDKVTDIGGEGIMINYGSRFYEQKRTDSLLKFKKVQSMDMKVVDIEISETGKYIGQTGSIVCEMINDNGQTISCKVGTGLSDEQRYNWSVHPENILGKIVEVQYFSLSTNKNDNSISLRFPRLKKIRDDKTETSEY